MKTFYKLGAFLLLAGFFNACGSGDKNISEREEKKPLIVDLDGEREKILYDTIEIVTPVLPEDEIIAEISKVQYFDNHFYILDCRQRKMMKFARDGQYAGTVSHRGTGPGEYSDIVDFDVTPDGKLNILDVSQGKIHVYSANTLEPINDLPIDCRGLRFAIADSTNFYFENVFAARGKRSKLVNYNLIDGKVETIFDYSLDNEDRAAGNGRTHIWRSGQKVLFYNRFSPTIYSLSDTIYPAYTFKTGDLPDETAIQQLINMSKAGPGQLDREDTAIIRDIQDVYVTPGYTSIRINSIPSQQLFIDNISGKMMEVTLDERFNDCKPGAIGIAEDAFITIKHNRENDIIELVLYKLKRQSID